MISNPVQPIAPAIPPTPMATPSHMPSKWAPPYNVSVFGPGIPLNSFDQNDKNDNNEKKKKKRRKGKKKEKVPLGPYPVVSPGMQIFRDFYTNHSVSYRQSGMLRALKMGRVVQ